MAVKIFLDANIIVAVLNNEYPRFDLAARILSLASSKKYILCTSALAISIAYYFSSKKSGAKIAYQKIKHLSEHLGMSVNKSKDLIHLFNNNKIKDIEDGLEYWSAKHYGCKFIISYDIHDFYFSDIEVLTPKEFLLQQLIK
jgi:predicted nucleic acid-binding protein